MAIDGGWKLDVRLVPNAAPIEMFWANDARVAATIRAASLKMTIFTSSRYCKSLTALIEPQDGSLKPLRRTGHRPNADVLPVALSTISRPGMTRGNPPVGLPGISV
jgi:hypothetical protein